jgi:hypothetical protein
MNRIWGVIWPMLVLALIVWVLGQLAVQLAQCEWPTW